MSEELLKVGQIVGVFGIKGQVKVKAMTSFPERFDKGRRLRLDGKWVDILASNFHKNQFILTLSGITDPDAARALQWKFLEIPAEARPDLDEDEFLTEDLIGLRVVTEDGRELGVVDEVYENPAHDVFRVGDVMIPAVKEFVLDVNLDEELMTVRLIPGMLPGEE